MTRALLESLAPACPRCRGLDVVRYGKRRGRFNTSDRLDPGPLYHVRNARRVLYDFRCWLKPFRGIATKHLLRYFSWYVRMAAMAPRADAAARLLFFEALAAYSLPRPG